MIVRSASAERPEVAEERLAGRILLLNAALLALAVSVIAGILIYSHGRILEKQSREHAAAVASYVAKHE
jgi:sensor histidine kinase regulating citrate/malate metabolism